MSRGTIPARVYTCEGILRFIKDMTERHINIDEIRRVNFLTLEQEHYDGVRAHFAADLGMQPSALSRLFAGHKDKRRIGDKLARRAEKVCGKPPNWLDERHDVPADTLSTELKQLMGEVLISMPVERLIRVFRVLIQNPQCCEALVPTENSALRGTAGIEPARYQRGMISPTQLTPMGKTGKPD